MTIWAMSGAKKCYPNVTVLHARTRRQNGWNCKSNFRFAAGAEKFWATNNINACHKTDFFFLNTFVIGQTEDSKFWAKFCKVSQAADVGKFNPKIPMFDPPRAQKKKP